VASKKEPEEPPGPVVHPRRLANPQARRPEHPKKEWDALVKQAWKAKWWCERRRKYIYCYSPNEEDIVKIPMTPSDWRTIRNKKRDFRDAGLTM
jgi:hypothetical protein